MLSFVNLIIAFVTRHSAYGVGVAGAAGISAILAVSFGIYYARAISFPLNDIFMTIIYIGSAVAVIGHAVQFGLLNKLGFPGFTRPVLAVNRFVIAAPDLQVRPDLDEADLVELLRALGLIPIYNALTPVIAVQIVFAAVLVAVQFTEPLTLNNYIHLLIMNLMVSFVHGGYCVAIGEIITGDLRAACKRRMHERQISFIDQTVTTVRLKLGFFIVFVFVVIYVAITLVYFNRDNIPGILLFTATAMASTIFMAYMIFNLIYTSLKDIGAAMDDLKSGGSGLVFSKSVDAEFVKVATGISEAAKTIKDYQANLEKKIEERTRQLADSLGKVEALKGQQDGDYFLTSLLLRPLSGNYANNGHMKVDIFTRQKKTFEFKARTNEIGGDICIAHSIHLRNRAYTLFLNGDAMGKSMQGAGGSLVLGAVLQSIVERTKLSPKERTLYPERWLKSIFIELQKTFESFDGSMLISIVMGLADEENGFVYLLNAEHPWSVIYRNGEARFIENSLMLRKLGTLGVNMGVQVLTFQLEPHDILIIGSDGRDDLVLGTDTHGVRIINEDEKLFLKHVIAARGNLESIYGACANTGEITDDFSLISLTYLPEEISPETKADIGAKIRYSRQLLAEKQYVGAVSELERAYAGSTGKTAEHLSKALAEIAIKTGDREKARKYFSIYSDLNPADTRAIFALGQSCMKERRLEEAFDVFNRLRIRNPSDTRATLQIAKILLQKTETEAAENMLRRFSEMYGSDPKIQALLDSIGNAG